MADREKEAQKAAKKNYLSDATEKYSLKPVAFGFFGGFIDFKKSHGTIVDVVVRVNSKKLLAQGFDTRKVHDTRNWESIEAWASEVARLASRS